MKTKIVLGLIIFLAIVFRLYKLTDIPPALYWDEASLGYNAYSISQTLRDEHGVFLPVSNFAAFGDYKAPGYIYADALVIKLFGLSEFTIRLPSALAGTLLVLVTFFLAQELLFLFRSAQSAGFTKLTSLLSALFVAVSPWSLQVSRAAFESNLATLLSTAGLYFFLRAVRARKTVFYVLSSIFLALSMYTFNSQRIFVPLILLALMAIFLREFLTQWKKLVIFGFLFLLLLLPLIPHLLSPEGKLRFNEVTWLNNASIVENSNKLVADNGDTIFAKVIYNRRVFYVQEFMAHYLDHFRFSFLFQNGDINPRLSTRNVGEFYLLDLVFLILGTVFVLKHRSKGTLIMLSWIALGIVPAAIARETPHALRILPVLPVPQIAAAMGLAWTLSALSKKKLLCQGFTLLILFGYIFCLLSYLYNYYLQYPTNYASSWQYGYKQAVSFVRSVGDKYDHISMTGRLGRPYIYFLLYGKYPPEKYWRTKVAYKDHFGFWTVDQFDKYIFSKDTTLPGKWLYVRSPADMPGSVNTFKSIRDPSGAVVFNFYDNL